MTSRLYQLDSQPTPANAVRPQFLQPFHRETPRRPRPCSTRSTRRPARRRSSRACRWERGPSSCPMPSTRITSSKRSASRSGRASASASARRMRALRRPCTRSTATSSRERSPRRPGGSVACWMPKRARRKRSTQFTSPRSRVTRLRTNARTWPASSKKARIPANATRTCNGPSSTRRNFCSSIRPLTRRSIDSKGRE